MGPLALAIFVRLFGVNLSQLDILVREEMWIY